MLRKLFGKKKNSFDEGASDKKSDDKKKQLQRAQTVAAPEMVERSKGAREDKPRKSDAAVSKSSGSNAGAKPKPKGDKLERKGSLTKRRKKKVEGSNPHVDLSKPLEFPCTPETVLEHHKHRSFLTANEEWLLVELNEYECLVDDMEIIKTVAKHSKFFEVDPPELWEEFFEFVDDVPAYDEVINYDVWQEFRDKVYPC